MAEHDLVIRLFGDASSLIRSVRSSSTELKSIGVTAQSSARLQIEASLKKDARLRQEASAYRAAASAAVKGSREQIVAANLADRANTRLARSLGVTSAESRAFARSAAAADRDLGHAVRGALAGSGIFRGLGRSIAFASGGFLAFASAGQFVRTSIDAAREAAVSQAQLAAQLKSSGKNFADYRQEIDKSNLALGALAGFQNDELNASFTTIFRSTRNVAKTLRDEGLAANIARARHIGLAAASTIVAKAEAGNVGIFRRAGLQIAKNATVEQALAVARARFAGQARAGTTTQERFGAVLHDTEEIIGAGLLPTLDRYLNKATEWLSQTKNQERIQRDVAATTKTVGDVIRGVSAVVTPLVSALRALGKVSGGTENEVKLLGGAFLIFKARSSLVKWGFIGTQIEGIGTKSLLATGEVEGLGARLGLLADINPIAIPITILFIDKHVRDSGKKLAEDILHPFNTSLTKGLKDEAGVVKSIAKFVLPFGGVAAASAKAVSRPATPDAPNPFAPSRFGSGDLGLGALTPAQKKAISKATSTPHGFTLQGRFNLLELRKANAAQTDSQRILRAIDVSEAAILRKQEASAKTLNDRTTFANQLAGVMGEIRGIDDASASAAKQAAADQKQAAAAAKTRLQDQRKAVQEALQGRQFRALGLDATGSPLTPATKALRRELGTVDKAITGTFLDTSKTQSVLSKIRRVLSGGLGAVTKDVRSQIKSMLDDLDQQLKDNATGPRTKFQKASTRKLLAGLGLDPDEFKAVRARLSQVGAGGTIPGTGPAGAFGAVPTSGDTVIPITFQLDGRTVAVNTTRHQVRARRRNPKQRRGFAGSR